MVPGGCVSRGVLRGVKRLGVVFLWLLGLAGVLVLANLGWRGDLVGVGFFVLKVAALRRAMLAGEGPC